MKSWFKAAGIKPGQDCILQCVSTKVGMGTFHCPDKCAELCDASLVQHLLHNVTLYPGLTKEERALIAQYPRDAWKDLANNRAGLLAAEELEKQGRRNQEALEERAMTELRNNRLVVLRKRGIPQ